MDTLKKILFPIFSLFLAYRTFDLMNQLVSNQTSSYSTLQIVIIAFLLTLFVTGIFAFVGFAYPTNRILPESYYTIKNPKKLTSIAKSMGVKHFKNLLIIAFWGNPKNRKKYFNGTKKGLENFIYQTKQSEFGHLAPLAVITIVCCILLAYGHYLLAAIATLINITGNLYPIILQRTHRIRIQKILKP